MTSINGNTDFDVHAQNSAVSAVPIEGIPDQSDATVAARAAVREPVRDAERAAPIIAEVSTTVDPTSAHDSVTSSQDARDHAGDAGHSRREHDDEEEDDMAAAVDEPAESAPVIEAVADAESSSASTETVTTDQSDAT